MPKDRSEEAREGLHKAKMIRMGEADLRRLEALKRRLELKEAAVFRLALRELARREGVE